MSENNTPLVKKIDISSLGTKAAEKEKTEKQQVEKAWTLFEETEASNSEEWFNVSEKIKNSPGYENQESIQLARAQALTNASAYSKNFEECKKYVYFIKELPHFDNSPEIQLEFAHALTNLSAYSGSEDETMEIIKDMQGIPAFNDSETIQYQLAEVLYNTAEITSELESKEEIVECMLDIPKFEESERIQLILSNAVKNIMMEAPNVEESRKIAGVIKNIPGYEESEELQQEYALALLQLMNDGVPMEYQEEIFEEINKIKAYRESEKLQYDYAVSMTTADMEKVGLDWSTIVKRIAALPKFEGAETIQLEYVRALSSLGQAIAEEENFDEDTWEEVLSQFDALMSSDTITPFAAGNIIGIWISMHSTLNETMGDKLPDFLSFDACFETIKHWLQDAEKLEDKEKMGVLCESIAGFSEQIDPEISVDIRAEIKEISKPYQGFGMFRE